MEQYWMPKNLDFDNLRMCLDNYETDWLHIRQTAPRGGIPIVNESLESKIFDFTKDNERVLFLIDGKEVFGFSMKSHKSEYTDGFSVAYERFEKIENGERLIRLDSGINPYDTMLPEPRRSFLRHFIDYHSIEIYFRGRIHLKLHSFEQRMNRKYWLIIDKPPK